MAKGKHPVNALTAMQIAKLSAAGRYADGNGLYLVVDTSGAKCQRRSKKGPDGGVILVHSVFEACPRSPWEGPARMAKA